MNVLIVDDERLARERLRSQLEEIAFASVAGEADNGLAAIRAVEQLAPDVILLDIRMPQMNGLEVARHLANLDNPPQVVFATAYDEHALAAFESNAIAYLLKPIRLQALTEALERARTMQAGQAREALGIDPGAAPDLARRRHVSSVVGGDLRLMAVDDIFYFQADQGYVSAVSAEGSLLLAESLRGLEDEFGDQFVRVHRNALVNTAHVAGLHRDASGNAVVRLPEDAGELVVSRRLLPAVRKRLRSS